MKAIKGTQNASNSQEQPSKRARMNQWQEEYLSLSQNVTNEYAGYTLPKHAQSVNMMTKFRVGDEGAEEKMIQLVESSIEGVRFLSNGADIDPKAFFGEFIAPRRPVATQNLSHQFLEACGVHSIKEWKNLWDIDRLTDVFGDQLVCVTPSYFTNDRHHFSPNYLGKYVSEADKGKPTLSIFAPFRSMFTTGDIMLGPQRGEDISKRQEIFNTSTSSSSGEGQYDLLLNSNLVEARWGNGKIVRGMAPPLFSPPLAVLPTKLGGAGTGGLSKSGLSKEGLLRAIAAVIGPELKVANVALRVAMVPNKSSKANNNNVNKKKSNGATTAQQQQQEQQEQEQKQKQKQKHDEVFDRTLSLRHDFYDTFIYVGRGKCKLTLFSPDNAFRCYTVGTVDKVLSNGIISYAGLWRDDDQRNTTTTAAAASLFTPTTTTTTANGGDSEDDGDESNGEKKGEDEGKSERNGSQPLLPIPPPLPSESSSPSSSPIVLPPGGLYLAHSDFKYYDEKGGDSDKGKGKRRDNNNNSSSKRNSDDISGTNRSSRSSSTNATPYNFSRIDIGGRSRIELNFDYPLFRGAVSTSVVLRSGQSIYIPAGWFYELSFKGDEEEEEGEEKEGQEPPASSSPPPSLSKSSLPFVCLRYWVHPPTSYHSCDRGRGKIEKPTNAAAAAGEGGGGGGQVGSSGGVSGGDYSRACAGDFERPYLIEEKVKQWDRKIQLELDTK